MRHKKKKITLGREKAHREAMLKNLAESLILHNKIKTTKAKAKALRTIVEPLITRAKIGNLAARRELIKALFTDDAVNKLMNELGPKYKDRKGGYTRIVKLAPRNSDSAEMARIELV
ncbi:50S ribosomal protein L17 [Patescibacteria group bacterium]|nr:50S ribosomal protein L17 [Patescibacteria group bacterium]